MLAMMDEITPATCLRVSFSARLADTNCCKIVNSRPQSIVKRQVNFAPDAKLETVLHGELVFPQTVSLRELLAYTYMRGENSVAE
jgi:hypothetical protein